MNLTSDPVEELLEAKISSECVASLFGFLGELNGPQNLQAVVGVCEVIHSLLKLSGFQDFPQALHDYSDTVLQIARNPALNQHPVFGANRRDPASKVLHGIISIHPEWSLMYYISQNNPEAFKRFQQGLLTALDICDREGYELKLGDIDDYCLSIRKLTDTTYGRDWLSKQSPSQLSSIPAIKDVFTKTLDSLKNDEAIDSHKVIPNDVEPDGGLNHDARLITMFQAPLRLLKVALGEKVTRREFSREERGGGGGGGSRTRGISALRESDFVVPLIDDNFGNQPHIFSIIENLPDDDRGDNKFQESLAFGLEPFELEDEIDLVLIEEELLQAPAQNFRETLRVRGAVKSIEMQNQFLPLSTQMLRADELAGVQSYIRDSLQSASCDRETALIASILRIMLITSSSLERVCSMQLISKDSEAAIGDLAFNVSEERWLIPIDFPKFKTSVDQKILDQNIVRDTSTSHVKLIDLLGTKARLEKALGVLANHLGARPFMAINDPKSTLAKILKKISPQASIYKVERYLYSFIASRFEATMASLVFGKTKHVSKTRSYYTAATFEHLNNVYQVACNHLMGLTPSANQVSPPKGYAGGRYCPLLGHVRDCLSGLWGSVEHARLELGSSSYTFVHFHNIYTVATLYSQGFFTALRSVIDPVLQPDDVLGHQNIAVIRDKDTEDRYHARCIPLHPIVKDTVESYSIHRARVLERLSLLNLPAAVALRPVQKRFEPFSFFLTDDYQVEISTPIKIAQHLKKYTGLPLNSNRKLIRTYLTEQNCLPMAIDLLMGHHNRGEEFWNSYSTVDFEELSEILMHYLDKLAIELEIHIRPGL